MKGIILSGGLGTRLHPLTKSCSKQLLPVYDKPMIYYPLSTLMVSGIQEILIISTKEALPLYKKLLGDGSSLGISLAYAVQERPGGIAEALLVGEKFLQGDSVALILGDNLFYASGLGKKMKTLTQNHKGARIFSYYVKDPERYGVLVENEEGKLQEIIEKPKRASSNHVVTGLYFYDEKATQFVKQLIPSERGELEITDLNNLYLQSDELSVTKLEEGSAWLDTGTPEALLQASNFVYTIEERQGLKIACLEQIAYEMGYISFEKLSELVSLYRPSSYGEYLKKFCERQRSFVKLESREIEERILL